MKIVVGPTTCSCKIAVSIVCFLIFTRRFYSKLNYVTCKFRWTTWRKLKLSVWKCAFYVRHQRVVSNLVMDEIVPELVSLRSMMISHYTDTRSCRRVKQLKMKWESQQKAQLQDMLFLKKWKILMMVLEDTTSAFPNPLSSGKPFSKAQTESSLKSFFWMSWIFLLTLFPEKWEYILQSRT